MIPIDLPSALLIAMWLLAVATGGLIGVLIWLTVSARVFLYLFYVAAGTLALLVWLPTVRLPL